MRTAFALLLMVLPAAAADFPRFEAREIDPHAGEIVYAVTVADVDGDRKPDVVAVTEDSVLWYKNPSWEKQVILRGKTERDNVCIQAHDIDGDGRIDFALGAGWHSASTTRASTLQWLGRDKGGEWQVHPIKCEEPTLHRIRWGDVLGNGQKQLVVAPLQGRGTKGPNWGKGQGSRICVYSVPKDPTEADWPMEVADETLHSVHNLQVVRSDLYETNVILLAAWEGVFTLRRTEAGRWERAKLGTGNQDSTPSKGASEIKRGILTGPVASSYYLATIEPWHGFQVVVYTVPAAAKLGKDGLLDRRVIDEPVTWGHAVWCADLDGDGDEELIVGQRDPNKDAAKGTRGPGVWVYDPKVEPTGLTFTKHAIDDGGMACEDAMAADLDGDGKPEIIAGGRATHNVKIYWNKAVGR